mgnify:FL=1
MRTIWHLAVAVCLCADVWGATASQPALTEADGELVLSSPTGMLVFSARDGHIVRLTNAEGAVLAGPSDQSNLWSVEPGVHQKNFGCFMSGPPLGKLNRAVYASTFGGEGNGFSWSWDQEAGRLTMVYESPREPVRVKAIVSSTADGFHFEPWISVDGPQSVDFQMPGRIRVDYKTIERFHVPNDYAVALTPKFFKEGRSFALRYPPAFCDLAMWTRSDGAGPVAIYRAEADRPMMPSTFSLLGGGADPDAAGLPCAFGRTYHFYAPDSAWIRCPAFEIAVGADMRAIGRRYGELRELGPTVAEKLPKDFYETLIRSVIIKYCSSTAAGQAAAARSDFRLMRENLSRFPSPSVIHNVSYIYYGFDRGYPDYLPPAWSGGGQEEFGLLIDAIHTQGKLWMPHTNPTFWNMVPSPENRTPGQHGEEHYLRDEAGEFVYNGGNFDSTAGGRIVSPMHPTVVEVNRRIMAEFCEQWKADMVFCDQLANRWGDFDYSPATGYPPHGYVQQLADLAGELKAIVPLAMEGGFDIQVPHAAVFHALSWPMMGDPAEETDYNGRYGKDGWEWSPMFQYAIHDRVISTLHNLGDKVDTPQRLSAVLAHGYSIMSNVGDGNCDTLADDSPEMRWLWWLDAVQKNVVARYLGREMLDFRYVGKYVVATKYPDLSLVVNLTKSPYEVADAGVTLGPYGWRVTSDDGQLEGVCAVKAFGQEFPSAVSVIRVRTAEGTRVWLHADQAGTIQVPDFDGELHAVELPRTPQKEAIVLKAAK